MVEDGYDQYLWQRAREQMFFNLLLRAKNRKEWVEIYAKGSYNPITGYVINIANGVVVVEDEDMTSYFNIEDIRIVHIVTDEKDDMI